MDNCHLNSECLNFLRAEDCLVDWTIRKLCLCIKCHCQFQGASKNHLDSTSGLRINASMPRTAGTAASQVGTCHERHRADIQRIKEKVGNQISGHQR
jgi:hypothetical protein